MAELILLQRSELFNSINTLLTNYNKNIQNQVLDQRINEKWKTTYKRWEGIYDQFEENLSHLEEILKKENEIQQFFNDCKANKEILKNHMNNMIDTILSFVENNSKTETELYEYKSIKREWNEKRYETPDQRNRRECEEMLVEIKEERSYVEKLMNELKREKEEAKSEREKLSSQKIDEINLNISNMKTEMNNYLKKNEINEINESLIEFQSDLSNYVKKDDNYKYLNHFNKYGLNVKECKQLEEWTNRHLGEVVFNSDIHDWNPKTSVFGKRILGKSNLLFLFEDKDKNLFGYYLSDVKIDWKDMKPVGKESFLCSLRNNGRLPGMMKFEILKENEGYVLHKSSDECLIRIGEGRAVMVQKKNCAAGYCNVSKTFNYHGYPDALIGKLSHWNDPLKEQNGLIVTRIVVIQTY